MYNYTYACITDAYASAKYIQCQKCTNIYK